VAAQEVVWVQIDDSPELKILDVRPLTPDERVLVDRDVQRRLRNASLRASLAAFDRVRGVFVRLRAVTPNLPSPQLGLSAVLLPVSDVSRSIFNLPQDTKGMVVAWVAPGTPAADVLKATDLVTSVDGHSVESGELSTPLDDDASMARFTIVR